MSFRATGPIVDAIDKLIEWRVELGKLDSSTPIHVCMHARARVECLEKIDKAKKELNARLFNLRSI